MDEAGSVVEHFRLAAFGLSDWETAMETLATRAGALAGHLAGFNRRGVPVLNVATNISPDMMSAWVDAGGADPQANPRVAAGMYAPPLRCVIEAQLTSAAQREQLPVYREVHAPCDLTDVTMIPLGWVRDVQSGVALMMPGLRDAMDARQQRLLEAAAPGIAQTISMGIALGSSTETTIVTTTERFAGPALILGADKSVLALSPAADAMMRDGTYLSRRAGRLIAHDGGTGGFDRAFHAAACNTAGTCGAVSAMLRPDIELPPLVVDLCPLPAPERGPLGLGRVMLIVRARPSQQEPAALLRDAFLLTGAESEIAMLVGAGHDIAEIVLRRGTSAATVRTQLKAIFGKTGTHRQAELAVIVQRFC